MKKQYFEVILENINGKFDTVLEVVADLPEIKTDVKILKEDMVEVKWRLKNVEEAVKDHSHGIVVLKTKHA